MKWRMTCIIVGLILLQKFSYSQISKNFISSLEYENIADSLAAINSFDLAANYYSLAMAGHLDNDLEAWYTTFGKFRINRYKGDNDLRLVDEIRKFTDELDLSQHLLRGKMLFYLGYYNSNLGFGNAAVIEYKKAIVELEKSGAPKSKSIHFLIASYQNIAINYSRMGDQKSAMKFIQKAKKLCSVHHVDSMESSLDLNYAKILFYDGNYRKMKQVLRKTIDGTSSNPIKSVAQDYLAEVYILEDSLSLAKYYLDKSYETNPHKQYQYYEIRGNYYQKVNRIHKAKLQFKTALNLLKYHTSKRSYRKALVNYANFLESINEKEESAVYAHLALSSFYRGLDTQNINDRSKIDESLPDLWIIEALYIKAKYFREQFLLNKDEFSLKESTFYYELLLSHFDQLKSKFYSSISQYRIGDYSQRIYAEIISFYVDQFQGNDDKESFENAFLLAQRSNSYVLKNAISERHALEIAGVSQDSIEKYLQLCTKVAFDFSKDSVFDSSTFFDLDSYKESLVANYPLYSNYKEEQEISLSDVQMNIDYRSLLIKYYFFDDVLTVFGISKHSFFVEKFSLNSELHSMINSNMELLSGNVSNESINNSYLVSSEKIYHKVLGQFLEKYQLKGIDHLIIVPDGPLKNVAFNALAIDTSKDMISPSTYLLSRFSICYLYYCSQIKKSKVSSQQKQNYLGFGIEYEKSFLKEILCHINLNNDYTSIGEDVSLSTLKFADDEVKYCAKLLNGECLLNTSVTLSSVLSRVNDYNIIHFSTHAFVDESDYLNSFIVLNRDKNETYRLKYSDILSLDIDPELVVLSACQTNAGANVSGEGLMSLSRAFVQSGSKSTVGSYWNTPDYATKELMTLFYKNLKNGNTKSNALRLAQLEFLSNDELSSPTIRTPFYWASWAVYGSDDVIYFDVPETDFILWAIILHIVVVGFIIFVLIKEYVNLQKLRT